MSNPYEPKYGRETNPTCSDFEATELAEAWDEGFAAALEAMTDDEAVKAAVMNLFVLDWWTTPRPEETTRIREALTAAVEAVKQEAGNE